MQRASEATGSTEVGRGRRPRPCRRDGLLAPHRHPPELLLPMPDRERPPQPAQGGPLGERGHAAGPACQGGRRSDAVPARDGALLHARVGVSAMGGVVRESGLSIGEFKKLL